MSDWHVVARQALRESVRRRVLQVVGVLSFGFLALYGLGARAAFDTTEQFSGFADEQALTAATLLGLGMFATLFLGAVLAVFLTNDAVRGDAERGLLQPLVVRPLGRPAYLVGRLAAALAVACTYVIVVWAACVLLTDLAGDAEMGKVVGPGLCLAGAVAILAAISLLGSVVFSGTANGIATFMIFGAGLTGGLLGEIGEGLNVETLEDVGRSISWALPFEALYQDGLRQLTQDVPGLAGEIVRLGPFGGARDAGPLLWPWALLFVAGLVGIAMRAFARSDL